MHPAVGRLIGVTTLWLQARALPAAVPELWTLRALRRQGRGRYFATKAANRRQTCTASVNRS